MQNWGDITPLVLGAIPWMWPPHRIPVTTRIITFLIGNPYKPAFTTVTGRGPYPSYTLVFQIPCEDRRLGAPHSHLLRIKAFRGSFHTDRHKVFGEFWKTRDTPPKSNIDSKNDGPWKMYPCKTWLFWVSMLDFMGVTLI